MFFNLSPYTLFPLPHLHSWYFHKLCSFCLTAAYIAKPRVMRTPCSQANSFNTHNHCWGCFPIHCPSGIPRFVLRLPCITPSWKLISFLKCPQSKILKMHDHTIAFSLEVSFAFQLNKMVNSRPP